MTEQEWLTCAYPHSLVGFVIKKTTERKLRLFAVACCQRVKHLVDDEPCRAALEVFERFADREAADAESWAAQQQVANYRAGVLGPAARKAARAIANAVWIHRNGTYDVLKQSARALARDPARGISDTAGWDAATACEQEIQAGLCRDVFGNPFRSPAFEQTWITPLVRNLAQAAYNIRIHPARTLDQDRLAVLADALEDAGCNEPAILEHLRGPGPHVRGCFVIDGLLRKE